jgi:hypothetical protein
MLPALFSIDLEQEARLDDHADRLDELEASLGSVQDSNVTGSELQEEEN